MNVRELKASELMSLLTLYRHLHIGSDTEANLDTIEAIWQELRVSPYHKYFGVFVDGQLVSSCALTLTPDLTNDCRPYGFIGNVVTHPRYRRQGFATAVMRCALDFSWKDNCCKVILLTSRRDDNTLQFLKSAGFDPSDKYAFVADRWATSLKSSRSHYHGAMCNLYRPPDAHTVARNFQLDTRGLLWPSSVHPRSPGPFVRRAVDDSGYSRELVVGQWALIPPWAKEAKLKYSTNNARSEEIAEKASYRDAWAKGQRCIIPAADFDEPNWESGKNVWWRFRRADGLPWALAGLWNTWVERATGEVHESYTMLTLNADQHPLMKRMHKPDPKLPADRQDKRSVIPIEMAQVDRWLAGTVDEASELLQLAPVEIFDAAPVQVGGRVSPKPQP